MKRLTIPRRQFDLRKLVKAIRTFTQAMDGHEPFPIVQGGVAIYDADLCDMLEDDAEVPDDPVERLEAGYSLYCTFGLCRDFDLLACADGTEIEVPDLDCDDEDEETALTQKQREMIDRTCCDENRSYGLLLTLNGQKIVIQSAQMCDLNGDCEVEVVKNAGLVDEPMRRWLDSFLIPERGRKR
jgi:hypothetical protein